MKKIFHEVPIAMLEQSRKFNDGDYALVHLFEKYPVYYNFYAESVRQGRHVILDNSIFELGTSFSNEQFFHWVEKLNPTEYIIPDALEDCQKTMDKAYDWKKYRDKIDSRCIGVVQGKSFEELVACYRYLNEEINVDKIAFSFDYSYYRNIYPHQNKFISYTFGRIKTLDMMIRDGLINVNKPHHLLGCALPIEFMFYRDYNWITSIDTSNPIVHGLLNIEYEAGGLLDKQSIKLVELINSKPNDEQLLLIAKNVELFKEYVNGKE